MHSGNSWCHLGFWPHSATVPQSIVVTKGVVKYLWSFEIAEQSGWFCFFYLTVRIIFHREFFALYKFFSSRLACWHYMMTFPNFTIWNTITIFEEHHVSDLLVNRRVVYQWQSFGACGIYLIWCAIGRLCVRVSITWLFKLVSLLTVILFHDWNMPWLVLDSDRFICFLLWLDRLRLQQWEPARDFICTKNISRQLLTRQCRFLTNALHSSKEGDAQLWTNIRLARRCPLRRFYPCLLWQELLTLGTKGCCLRGYQWNNGDTRHQARRYWWMSCFKTFF